MADFGGRQTLDDATRDLEAAARQELAQRWGAVRWDFWVQLEWRVRVSEFSANEHLERLIRDLHRTASPTIRLVAGFHDDPGHVHAHALIALSRRLRVRFSTAQEFGLWLRHWWYHGDVWAAEYDPERESPSGVGGAVAYLARHPETVVFG